MLLDSRYPLATAQRAAEAAAIRRPRCSNSAFPANTVSRLSVSRKCASSPSEKADSPAVGDGAVDGTGNGGDVGVAGVAGVAAVVFRRCRIWAIASRQRAASVRQNFGSLRFSAYHRRLRSRARFAAQRWRVQHFCRDGLWRLGSKGFWQCAHRHGCWQCSCPAASVLLSFISATPGKMPEDTGSHHGRGSGK